MDLVLDASCRPVARSTCRGGNRRGHSPGPWDRPLGHSHGATSCRTQYYKFYANTVVALAWAYATGGYALGWRGLLYFPLAALFFVCSRDALGKYYDRGGRLLGPDEVTAPSGPPGPA